MKRSFSVAYAVRRTCQTIVFKVPGMEGGPEMEWKVQLPLWK